MADYTLAYTGAQVDEALGKTAQINGHNFIDNSRFLVNQKRWSSGFPATSEYPIDRWRTSNAATSVELDETGMTIRAGTADATPYLLQPVEDEMTRILLGKSVTLSETNGAGALSSATGTLPQTVPTTTVVYCNITNRAQLIFISSRLYIRLLAAQGGLSKFTAVKLELGATSTLSADVHSIALETLRCQRFYHLYATAAARPSAAEDCVPTMRATPSQTTVTIGGVTYYANSANL